MKGLELAREFYKAYGIKLIEEDFKEIKDNLSVCLIGGGSECYGFDDEISTDHDFEPAFMIFLPDDIDDNIAFELERAYNKLPKEFMGYKRNILSPVGGRRHGVFKIGDYLEEHLGRRDSKLNIQEWLTLPEYVFSEITNGEVFYDPSNLINDVRRDLLNMPEDVLLKRLAGNLLIMGQAGQYNYPRMIKRNEKAAAQLAINEFVKACMRVLFLLNRRYMPYYKWSFRALRELDIETITVEMLEYLIQSDNSEEEVKIKTQMINDLCESVIKSLKLQAFTTLDDNDLEKQAYEINKKIKDINVRNLDVLVSI